MSLVSWPVGLVLTDLAESKNHCLSWYCRFGILTLLDDEIKVPGGDDMKFVHKVEEHHRGSEVFIIDTKRRFKNALSFEIEHYAGNVKYDASRFMAKNVDTVFRDMHDALSKSKNELLASLFRGEEQRIRTISHQFRGQLKDLMDTLSQTESRFIRCIKPNGDMLPKKLEPTACVDQLRYSGVFEAVDIRKKVRKPYIYTWEISRETIATCVLLRYVARVSVFDTSSNELRSLDMASVHVATYINMLSSQWLTHPVLRVIHSDMGTGSLPTVMVASTLSTRTQRTRILTSLATAERSYPRQRRISPGCKSGGPACFIAQRNTSCCTSFAVWRWRFLCRKCKVSCAVTLCASSQSNSLALS